MLNNCYLFAQNFCSQNLYSQWGNIHARGSTETQNVFTRAIAHSDVNLEHVIINGKVLSLWGNVSASFSKLDQVAAHSNIDLISSSTRDLRSIFGQVSANQSTLGNVTAHGSIDLINSSAADLRSKWGDVNVKRTTEGQSKVSSITSHVNVSVDRASVDGTIWSSWGRISANQSKLGVVTAHKEIDLIDSSATDLRSEWGNVTIRQTDRTQRIVSHITACNTVIAENCLIEGITLHVNQDGKAILDLTNTKVSDKIVIKVNDLFGDVTRIFLSVFSWFFENESKHFSLLIKGTEMPENISFEGFDADEIVSQMTTDGILVTGRKK